MTFEHAEKTVQKLSDEGIGNLCQAACLDGILRYANIGEAHYRNISQAVSDGDYDRFDQGVESMTRPIFPEDVHQIRGYGYLINPGNPFTKQPEDRWDTPRPEHSKLLDLIPMIEEGGVKYENEENRLWARRARENWAGLYIVLDNMFRDGLTVMVEKQNNDDDAHICGLQQAGPDEFYVVDTKTEEDGSTVIAKYGPSTLLEMCGFADSSRPAEWPETEEGERVNYFWVEAEDGTQRYSLKIFPAEPRP